MGLFNKMVRIASIPLVILTGCSAQSEEDNRFTAPDRKPLVVPPVDHDQPLPRPQQGSTGQMAAVSQSGTWANLTEVNVPQVSFAVPQGRLSVPADTRNPKLVETGVIEWLDARPEYTLPHKIAILHRMRQESSFNPCAENGPMKFLLQWRDDRLMQLHKWTRTRPGTCPSWLSQMAYMDSEIKHDPKWASFFSTRTKQAAYKVFTSVYLVGVLGSYP